MNSFNQTNPVENYQNILKNIQESGEKLQKLKEKSGKLIVQLIQNPVLNRLFISNIALIKKYFALQIQLNTILKKTTGFIPFSSKYYNYVIGLNQDILLKITTLDAIIQSGDSNKIQSYINSLSNAEMGGIYLSLGDQIRNATANGLNKLADNVRNFDPNKIITQAQSGLESLQANLQSGVNNLTTKISEITPSAPPLEPPSYEEATRIPQSAGGQDLFNNIYHPQLNRWVSINSKEGVDALLKYAYYNT